MAKTAAAWFWSRLRALVRSDRIWPSRLLAVLIALLLLPLLLPFLAWPAVAQGDPARTEAVKLDPARAEPVKGEATFSAPNGYARLVLKFADDVATDVVSAGSILVIRFNRPVDLPVEALVDAVPSYVSAARRDPDGTAIRLSL